MVDPIDVYSAQTPRPSLMAVPLPGKAGAACMGTNTTIADATT